MLSSAKHSAAFNRALLGKLFRTDFCKFNERAFEELHGSPLVPCWHHQAIASVLEHVASGKLKRVLITMPPRSLKSHMISVAFPAWLMGLDPTKRIITTSYGEELAVTFANEWRRILQSQWYKFAFPKAQVSPRKNREGETHLTKGGSRLSLSAGGPLTGRGADLIIVDDPLKSSDAYFEAARSRINDWFGQTLVSRLNNKRTGAIIVVMQRLHPDDLAGNLIEKGEWVHLNLPAIAPTNTLIDLGHGKEMQWLAGEPLQLQREPLDILESLKRDIGTRDFNAQYLQTPVPDEGNVIKLTYFQRGTPETDASGKTELVISVDTANVGKKTSDFSVIQVWQTFGKSFLLVDQVRGQWDYPKLRSELASISEKLGRPRILIEEAGVAFALIKEIRLDGHNAKVVRPIGSKEQRLAKVLPMIESEHIFLPEHAGWLGDFEAEIAAFPAGRYDDQVDAMTQFLGWAQSYSSFDPSTIPQIRLPWG